MMHPQKNHFHTSFFKPGTESARRNRNMVIQLVLVWALAVFGFHILLKLIEKPVPEPAYTVYKEHWQGIKDGNMDKEALQLVSRSALSVLGKVMIQADHREALDNAVSWMAWNIADSSRKEELKNAVSAFEEIAESTEKITDKDYISIKNELIPLLQNIFNLNPNDVRAKIAPLEVKTSLMDSFGEDKMEVFEEAMGLYLIHNRSVLTDTVFLGFPFHYFYTAVFLLILFVGLTLIYCIRTDNLNKRYNIAD